MNAHQNTHAANALNMEPPSIWLPQIRNMGAAPRTAFRFTAISIFAAIAMSAWMSNAQFDKSFTARGVIAANYLTEDGRGDLLRQVNPMLAGELVALNVSEADTFQDGTVLFRVRADILLNQLEQTKTKLVSIQDQIAQLNLLQQQIEAECLERDGVLAAQIEEAKEKFEFEESKRLLALKKVMVGREQAKIEYERATKLWNSHSIAKQRLEQLGAILDVADLHVAELKVRTPNKRIQTLTRTRSFEKARYQTLKDAKAQKRLDLSKEVAVLNLEHDQLSLKIDRSEFKAPYDGFVRSTMATIGNWVDTRDIVLEIAPSAPSLLLNVYVNPQHIGLVKKNQQVECFADTFDRINDRPLIGKVIKIPTAVSNDKSNTEQYGNYVVTVQIQVDASETSRVKIGTPCQCSIFVEERVSGIHWLFENLARKVHEP